MLFRSFMMHIVGSSKFFDGFCRGCRELVVHPSNFHPIMKPENDPQFRCYDFTPMGHMSAGTARPTTQLPRERGLLFRGYHKTMYCYSMSFHTKPLLENDIYFFIPKGMFEISTCGTTIILCSGDRQIQIHFHQ